MTTDDTLDRSVLDGWRQMQMEGEPDLVAELVEAFKGEAPALINGIKAAITESNPNKLRQAAHSLKGSSGNLGAKRLQTICAELEKLGRSGTVEGAAPLAEQVEPEYARVSDALDAEIRGA